MKQLYKLSLVGGTLGSSFFIGPIKPWVISSSSSRANKLQQHATGCANDAACTIQQFWELLANNAKIASIVNNVFTANLCICILGVNSSNGGITNPKCGDGYSVPQNQGASFFCRPSLYGRYVTIRRPERTDGLTLCEVEVYSARRGREPSWISVMHYALAFTQDRAKILCVVFSRFFF